MIYIYGRWYPHVLLPPPVHFKDFKDFKDSKENSDFKDFKNYKD